MRVQSLKYGLMAFVMTFALDVYAAQPYAPVYGDPLFEPWRWRTFPELKGLGAGCMAEDHDGNFWFGITHGVVRYDGFKWVTFTPDDGLLGRPVHALVVAQDGSVYAGSAQGISRFNNGVWQPIFPTSQDRATGLDEVLPWIIYDLTQTSDGSIWAGTEMGALQIRENKVTLYTSSANVAALRILAPTVDLVVLPERLTPRRNHVLDVGIAGTIGIQEQFLATEFEPWGITVVPEGSDLKAGDLVIKEKPSPDALVLTVRRQGLLEPFDVTLKYASDMRFPYFSVRDVYEDRTGAIWLSLYHGEIVSCGPAQASHESWVDQWQIYSKKDGLDIGGGTQVYQTRDGTIWGISNDRADINIFDGKTWTTLSPAEKLNPSIIETQDGTLWIGSYGGRLHVNRNAGSPDAWTSHVPPDIPTPRGRIIALHEASDGALWILGLGREVVRLDLQAIGSRTFQKMRYGAESPDGTRWFIATNGHVIGAKPSAQGTQWAQWTKADGLMAGPNRLIASRDGKIWAFGNHKGAVAAAYLDVQAEWPASRWVLTTHDNFAQSMTTRSEFAPKAGGVMFGARFLSAGDLGGVIHLKFEDSNNQNIKKIHLTPPDVPLRIITAISEAPNGDLWIGCTQGLYKFDGMIGQRIEPVPELRAYIDALYISQKGMLWAGTRQFGIFSCDVTQDESKWVWTQHAWRDGLAENQIISITETSDGHIWATTHTGISRFDGSVWITHALPKELLETGRYPELKQTQDGNLWVNLSGPTRTVHFIPDKNPPETNITYGLDQVSQPGNVTLSWTGKDAWHTTPDDAIQFAYRMDGGAWSSYSSDRNRVFETLSSGTHTFEVKARDGDFNEDPTPATLHFTVLPPVYQEPWFVALMFVSATLIALQTYRVIRRDRRLQISNSALSQANKDLFDVNKQLNVAKEEADQTRIGAETANRAKSTFLANMSHEIRTPMNAILGYAQILNNDQNLNSNQRKAVDTIGQSGEHLLGLINDILDISKIEAGHEQLTPIDFDLNGMLDGLGNMFDMRCRQKDLMWHLKSDVPEGLVHGDESKLRQVLINLVGNAVKFTEQGRITLTVQAQENHQYCFEVADTGQGIAKEKQAVIFEPFQQDESGIEYGGTGLGLAISLRHVDMMGGTITLASEVGEGSTFAFTLRLPPGNQAVEARDTTDWSRVSRLADGQSVRALVVDDVANNIDILANMLTKIGVVVQTAQSGQEALDLIREDLPDIVFTDIRMPVMDGAALLGHILEAYGEQAPKVVAATASVFEHQRQRYFDMGFDAFVNKPIQFENIYASLSEQLGVTYVFDEQKPAHVLPSETNWQNIAVPSELLKNLKTAAQDHSITDIREFVDELKKIENLQGLAQHLHDLSFKLDIAGIQAILNDLQSE